MGHEICWFFSTENWNPVSRNPLCGLWSKLVFRRNSTTQIVYLTSAVFFSGGTEYSDLCLGGTHLLVLCSGLLLIQCFDLGFLLIFFFWAELHLTKCVLEFCWSWIFIRRTATNLVKHDYPAASSFPNLRSNLYQPQWQTNWSRILILRTLGSWFWGPWGFLMGWSCKLTNASCLRGHLECEPFYHGCIHGNYILNRRYKVMLQINDRCITILYMWNIK